MCCMLIEKNSCIYILYYMINLATSLDNIPISEGYKIYNSLDPSFVIITIYFVSLIHA